MDPDLSIVLLGNSGAGKSSSGNTILGRAAFESKLVFRPVTTEICEAAGRVFERQINVTDTPGILASEEEIKTLCQSLLRSCRPVLFLVVLRIGRFTTEEQEAVEAAIRVLGPQGRKKSYLLFTGGDLLKDTTLTEFIFGQEKSSLPDVVLKFEKAYHVFNNGDKDQEQVRKLLLKSGLLHAGPGPV
ncbi:hypothetical protein INR49_008350 [Caranx melampygus]|nr:hypothetical protein INR49_008350 [Caranx melampygus]